MFSRLQTKLTVLYAGLFAVALGLVVVTVHLAVARVAQQGARRELIAAGAVFDRVLALRGDRLQDGADRLSRDRALRAAVIAGDGSAVDAAVSDPRQRLDLDLAFVVGVDGGLIGLDSGGLDAPALRRALAAGDRARGVFVIDGAPYQMISAPIASPTPVGWVVLAAGLDEGEMRTPERLSALALDAQVLARRAGRWVGARDGVDAGPLAALVDAALAVGPGTPGRVRTADGDQLALAKPLTPLSADAPAVLLIRYSMASAMAPYRPLTAAVLVVGLVGAALLIAASWTLSRGLARPIIGLDAAARRLRRGEDARVPVETRDEIGRLAVSFNRMAAEIREREDKITALALQDIETGLPNRRAVEREIAARLIAVGRDQEVLVAALGVDRFAFVRGAIGHQLSNLLMAELGLRLSALNPNVYVGRLSTATLGVVVTVADADASMARAPSMTSRLEAPVQVGGATVDLHLTHGLAASGRDGRDAARLVERAMIALGQGRAAGRKFARFDAAAYGDPAGNLSLMSQMLQGVDDGAVFLHHQPKLDLRSGQITGVEALVRWNHPSRGLLGPDLFIGMAEETGHIRALTDFVLDQAIRDQAVLRAAGHDLQISVNISGRLVDDPDFATQAIARIQAAGARLCFELTETAVIGNPETALGLLERFAAAGVSVSIDDYGSGLSSLAYLKQIKADELKIDKAFILSLVDDGRDALLVRSTVDLAHSLGLKVTAEGVETASALALLTVMGCDLAQGYFIAKPMALDRLLPFLADWDADQVVEDLARRA